MTTTRRELLATAAITAGAVLLPSAPALGRRRTAPEHVILIDWDGFGADFLERAPMPNLQALIARGSLTLTDSTYSTYSNSARASMSTGAYPEVHGNAGYYLDRAQNIVMSQNRILEAQTINQALAEAGRTTASVGWYMVQNFGTTYGDPEHLYVQPGTATKYRGQLGGAWATRVDVAIDILNLRPVDSGGTRVTVPKVPAFLAVLAGEIDGLIHGTGPATPDLAPLLDAYDAHLGRLVRAVSDAGLAEQTAFMLTADHAMGAWNPSVMPALVEAINATGFRPEVVNVGRSPASTTDIVLTSNGVRMSNVYLRNAAAGDDGRAAVRRAAERVGHIPNVFDERDLRRLRASDKLGDMALEAQPPYHFSLLNDGKDRGSHGSTFERAVPLVLAGAGVRRRRKALDHASLVDVAPTIAALLGVDPPEQSQGRAMLRALDSAALQGAGR